ncbi:MAG: phosphoribosylformylglycinamidine synthase [Bacteroidales bacterium]|jgi:phosphoribosylformylglycinamidine synthase|nr:phosphoribosylformylglycinamidine synthase [Bacteroidales bacterium]
MIIFFKTDKQSIIAVETNQLISPDDGKKLNWLFGNAIRLESDHVDGSCVGPRKEMVTPWSTNAVEITQNMGITGINRIEEYFPVETERTEYDPMLQRVYTVLDQSLFTVDKKRQPVIYVDDVAAFNRQEGLALSAEEIAYLNALCTKINRKLTDSEVFGFSQVNSEHCRHKIFNGRFIIDGQEKENSLFALIKKTSEINQNRLLSAYKDNVAFNKGPVIEQFAPSNAETSAYFETKNICTAISLKAETHNFPTTVEPFNGAATGTGGEIRDRLGGGKGSLPFAGTAVYMTAYPRTIPDRAWENAFPPRKWLYQTPEQILIKASNGASDFGNKFGQPLICGSVLTFEHTENGKKYAYDKVIMMAGGVGFTGLCDCLKDTPTPGEKIVVLGGDNYRIGMGGGAVSSVNTGEYENAIELNAVQRANPEMQKRVANVIRALVESDGNPIVSIHDHGAGGHLNCLSELIESTGGKIDIAKLPVGDPTLSAKEIIGNESQERMGLLIREKDIARVQQIAERERAPMYVVGQTTGDMQFVFEQPDGTRPIDLKLEDMFGNPPRTILEDKTVTEKYQPLTYDITQLHVYLEHVLQLENVACKDWLTNKVDRSVTGKVAQQQCQGEIQLPLSDCGVVALDYLGENGIATSIGHAPQAALADPEKGSILAVAEALTNIVFAPLTGNSLASVSLSANWMWPCRNNGEDARLYRAVKSLSDFCCELGINVPTGKDSLSMTQKYDNEKVISPGTVIVSAAAEVSDIKKTVSPVIVNDTLTCLYYVDFSSDKLQLGGSAFAQSLNRIGDEVPTVRNVDYFNDAFCIIQLLISKGLILSGHDISAGGLLTALLEMCFGNRNGGLSIDLSIPFATGDIVTLLFSENPAVIIQVREWQIVEDYLKHNEIRFARIGNPIDERKLLVWKDEETYTFNIDAYRDIWFSSSWLLDRAQSGEICAKARFDNYGCQPLSFRFNSAFTGELSLYGLSVKRKTKTGVRAAIIREKGVNGDREMAYALFLAGFDVKDVHMTDLISGRETLEDINMVVYCGGFSNSDVLGSAKGWAGGFLYNEQAKKTLDAFYARNNTLSLGICNGCQLMMELELICPEYAEHPKMQQNDSHKFESNFIALEIPENHSIMLGSLAGSRLGIWVAHGEGKFYLPCSEERYHVIARYAYDAYPANPNGSPSAIAGICSADGRHLAMMPHLERSIFPWQWAHYPLNRKDIDQITPWIEAFVNARKWINDF